MPRSDPRGTDSRGRVIAPPFTGSLTDLVTHLVAFHGKPPVFATMDDDDARRRFQRYGSHLIDPQQIANAEALACEEATADRARALHTDLHFQHGMGRLDHPVPHWHATEG